MSKFFKISIKFMNLSLLSNNIPFTLSLIKSFGPFEQLDSIKIKDLVIPASVLTKPGSSQSELISAPLNYKNILKYLYNQLKINKNYFFL